MGELTIFTSSSLLLPHRHTRPNPKNPNPKNTSKPLLSDVRLNLTATSTADPSPAPDTRRLLKYYARLASKLAGAGKLLDFLMLAETVLTSEAVAGEAPQFVARIDTRMVAAGIADAVREGRFGQVMDFLAGAARLGISLATLVDGKAMDEMGKECRKLAEERRLEELVGLMETLAG